MPTPLRIHLAAPETPLTRKTQAILEHYLQERGVGSTSTSVADKKSSDLILAIQPGIGAEGFRIEDGLRGAARVIGNDERGLLYGVGKFLRDARFQAGGFKPGPWRGASVPEKPFRGMYFATHFHNFYHDAPIAAVTRYIEDLALWGCNSLTVWFDMHHFTGLNEPAAQAMIQRLRAMLAAAEAVGMGPGLIILANEGYADSPPDLRAEWAAQNGYRRAPGGHYHVELCPNKPGGLDLILKWRREMLDAFGDIKLKYATLWPYDQGGCTCAACAPWGINGYLKTARPLAGLIRQKFPSARIIFSTWYFNRFIDGEWEGLAEAFKNGKPDWCDYLMADDFGPAFPPYPLAHGVPGGLPMLNFPEISMYECSPWGGYGANPLPRHLQAIWDACGSKVAGGFPYSEGIFEDLNKVIELGFYWNPKRPARETVREYMAGEFSPGTADDLVQATEFMETGHTHSRRFDKAIQRYAHMAKDLSRAEACFKLVKTADASLAPAVRTGWRWRIFYLRAALDAEFAKAVPVAGGGVPASEQAEAYFDELTDIYHGAQAEGRVAPPSRRLFQRLSEKK